MLSFKKVKIQDIDPLDGKYCLRYSLKDDLLTESIKNQGLMAPLLCRKTDSGRYELISGFKRFYALLSISWGEDIPISVIKEGLSEEQLFSFALDMNYRQSYSELDFSVLFSKLLGSDALKENRDITKWFNRHGIDVSLKQIDCYQKVQLLNKEILESVYHGQLPFRGIWDLAEFSPEEQGLLWNSVLSLFVFTSSEIQLLAQLLKDLKHIHDHALGDILKKPELFSLIEEAGEGKERLRSEKLIAVLNQCRYPKSFEAKKEFRKKISKIKFKQKIQLVKSESMEEEGVELRVRIKNKKDLSLVLEELEEKKSILEDLL